MLIVIKHIVNRSNTTYNYSKQFACVFVCNSCYFYDHAMFWYYLIAF